jgi:hypothetical protein
LAGLLYQKSQAEMPIRVNITTGKSTQALKDCYGINVLITRYALVEVPLARAQPGATFANADSSVTLSIRSTFGPTTVTLRGRNPAHSNDLKALQSCR